MPNTKSAKKALRQSEKNRVKNLRQKREVNEVIKDYKKSVESGDTSAAQEKLSAVFKKVDKAAKRNLIKGNKASRMKSRLSRLLGGSGGETNKTPVVEVSSEETTATEDQD